MYLVGSQGFEAGENGLESALAAAYEARIRPLCLCSEPPLPVYITRLGVTFMLKRMPFTGSQHAVGCSHYEPPAELLGLGGVLSSAIFEDPDTGLTQLNVDFALSSGPSPRVPQRTASETPSVRSTGSRLSLRGLLQFLWNEGELTKWKPAFAGKRTWAVVRHHLLRAAANKILKGKPLASVMFIPESFTVADKEQIAARRARRFADGLRGPGQSQGKMIVIGEIKEIVPARYRFNIVLKHLPDMRFSVDANVYQRTVRMFDCELALWRSSVDVHLMIVATFTLTEWGQPTIVEMSLLTVSAQWIPADDAAELRMTDRLVQENRSFQKVLRFNEKLSPSAIHLDVDSGPLGLARDRDWDCEEGVPAGSPERLGSGPEWLWRAR